MPKDHVYICHSQPDKDFALQLANDLRSRGVTVWREGDNQGAFLEPQPQLEEAIKNCEAFLILLSLHASLALNLPPELSLANNASKKIIPLLLGLSEVPDAFRYQVGGIQPLAFEQSEYERSLDGLMQVLMLEGIPVSPPQAVKDLEYDLLPEPEAELESKPEPMSKAEPKIDMALLYESMPETGDDPALEPTPEPEPEPKAEPIPKPEPPPKPPPKPPPPPIPKSKSEAMDMLESILESRYKPGETLDDVGDYDSPIKQWLESEPPVVKSLLDIVKPGAKPQDLIEYEPLARKKVSDEIENISIMTGLSRGWVVGIVVLCSMCMLWFFCISVLGSIPSLPSP